MGGPPWPPLNRKRFIEGGAATEDRPYRTTDFSDPIPLESVSTRQDNPSSGGRTFLIGSPRAAGFTTHLCKMRFDARNRNLQFCFRSPLDGALIESSARQVV